MQFGGKSVRHNVDTASFAGVSPRLNFEKKL